MDIYHLQLPTHEDELEDAVTTPALLDPAACLTDENAQH